MIPILYEANETAFVSNGLGRLRDILVARCVEERNGVFELDFDYPVDGAHYDEIKAGRIVYATHDDTGIPQPFDIVSYSRPINGVVSVHCVHVSYRQTGLTVYGTNINSLSDAFAMLANAEPNNPFTYSADFSSSAFMASADGTPRTVRQFLGGIEGSILDTYGGEYEFDGFKVILHKERGVVRDWSIRYGVNMTEYNEDADFFGTYTSCVPYWTGTDTNGADVRVVGDRVDYSGSSYNGRNDCVPLDLTDKFETKPTKAQVEAEALRVMNAQRPNLPATTIEVNFLRLQDAGITGFDQLLACHLCDTVNVVYPFGNATGQYKIVRTEWDVVADRYIGLTLGTLSTTLSEALGISEALDRLDGGVVDPEDYITAKGTSGEWKFRKWHSGTVEAWCVHNFGSQTGSAWGNIYYKELDLSIPSGIFTTAPNRIYITGSGRQWWVVGYSSATTTQIQTIRFARPASSASTIWANVYAVYLP